MAKTPNLEEIEELLTRKSRIELTDAQYEKKTGRELPKQSYYLKKQSALAKLCKKHGFSVDVQEKKVILTKEKGER